MNLFREDGHLTDEGIQALESDNLDEMQRLEAAEHLAFCDCCVARQLALMVDENALLCIPETFVRSIMKRVKKRGRKVYFARWTITAAGLVLALWGAGLVFAVTQPQMAILQNQEAVRQSEPAPLFGSRMNAATGELFAKMNNAFNGWKAQDIFHLHIRNAQTDILEQDSPTREPGTSQSTPDVSNSIGE